MPSTAELTETYVNEHQTIKDCLRNNVINYTKLSKKIAKDLGIEKKSSIEAILIALRRLALKLKKDKPHEDLVLDILKNSELEIKNKIVVATVEKSHYIEHLIDVEKKVRKSADLFIAIEGASVFTIITSEKHLDLVTTTCSGHIKQTSKNLALITIKSPETMEETPGVVGHLFSLFGQHGINIVEQMSCWTDTLVIISEQDVPAVMNFLGTYR